MAYLYAALKAAVQAGADALGRLPKIALGTLGEMEWPTSGHGKKVRDTGQLWATGESPIDIILKYLCLELDRAPIAWALIMTNQAGVPPTLLGHSWVTGVTKDELNDQITVTWSPAFLTATDYVVFSNTVTTPGCPEYSNRLANSTTIDFVSPITGLAIGINLNLIYFAAIGAV